MNPPSLGYVILYVNDVATSLAFYEKAFGLTRRFFHDDNGKAYGELETGAARLAFASIALAKEHLKQEIVAAAPDKAPLGVEIALTTPDVPALFKRAVNAGVLPRKARHRSAAQVNRVPAHRSSAPRYRSSRSPVY
jgi:lactoylglutathione lyase